MVTSSFHATRILVIGEQVRKIDDSEADNIGLMERTIERLQQYGYSAIEIVTKKHQVLSAVKSYKPNVIILYVMVEEYPDGFELCREIRELNETQNTPIIGLAGGCFLKFFCREGVDYAFNAYIAKDEDNGLGEYIKEILTEIQLNNIPRRVLDQYMRSVN